MGSKNKRVSGRHFSLVAMSNHGKSYWAEKLQKLGFRWICIDALIEEELRPELVASDYGAGTEAVSAWLGRVSDDHYEINQQRYLELEERFTREALLSLDPDVPTVIDTTGSVAHMPAELLALLQELTIVIFLDSNAEKKTEAIVLYLAKPKPVAFVGFWKRIWNQLEEPERQTKLATAVTDLQTFRVGVFEDSADVVLPYEFHHRSNLTEDEFLGAIEVGIR